jgi:hypothetical protein
MAKDVLARHRPESPEAGSLVFPGRNGDCPIVIAKAWYSALSEAGIEDFRFHESAAVDLRDLGRQPCHVLRSGGIRAVSP